MDTAKTKMQELIEQHAQVIVKEALELRIKELILEFQGLSKTNHDPVTFGGGGWEAEIEVKTAPQINVTMQGVLAAALKKSNGAPPNAPEKSPEPRKLTDAAMRCKWTTNDGTRCGTRSKGSRFHFLCNGHHVFFKRMSPEKRNKWLEAHRVAK